MADASLSASELDELRERDIHAEHPSSQSQSLTVPATLDHSGVRLDVFLVKRLPQYSRAHIQKMIRGGKVLVDDRQAKASYPLKAGEVVEVRAGGETPSLRQQQLPPVSDLPRAPQLDVLYEDDFVLAVNKPRGMVVHPAVSGSEGISGVSRSTLVERLMARGQPLSTIGGADRPGIVHRLDKDTSGVVLIAKSDEAHVRLARQFKERTVQKKYMALVNGCPRPSSSVIETTIGRHPQHRKKMSARALTGKLAVTEYVIREVFGQSSGSGGIALLEVHIHTGRTHQIRVHLSHIGHPVVGDPTYGGRKRALHAAARMKSPALTRAITELSGQALHACAVTFAHPMTGQPLKVEAPLPEDMKQLLAALREMPER